MSDEHEQRQKWIICHRCNGDGKHSHDLGAFTQSDRDEMGPDDWDTYMGGGYDRTCEICKGAGKVRGDLDPEPTEDADPNEDRFCMNGWSLDKEREPFGF